MCYVQTFELLWSLSREKYVYFNHRSADFKALEKPNQFLSTHLHKLFEMTSIWKVDGWKTVTKTDRSLDNVSECQ